MTTDITCYDGKTYDSQQLANRYGVITVTRTEIANLAEGLVAPCSVGANVYLTQDAYLDFDHAANETVYAAAGVDMDGNRYRVTWGIDNPDADDESDAVSDWSAVRSAEIYEAA